MKKLLSAIGCCLVLCVGINTLATGAAPVFTGGHYQTIPDVCESAGTYYINYWMTAFDADMGETLTWSVITPAVHGTVAVSYSTATAADTMYTEGATYTTSTGYVGLDSFTVMVSDGTTYDTSVIYVVVNPLPNAGTITGTATFCPGQVETLTGSVAGGMWFSTSASVATVSATGVVTAISAGTDTISHVVTNTCGVAVVHHLITVLPAPDAGTLTGASIFCNGSSATLTASATGGTWSASNSNATVAAGVVTGAAAGGDTILYMVTNSCGTDTAMHMVTVEDPLTTSGIISGTLVGCAGASITFTETHSDGVWSHTASTGSIGADGVLVLGSGPTDTVIYTRTNSCNSMAATAPVTITPMPDAGTISGYDSVCQGSTIVLSSSSAGGTWSSTIPDFADIDATGTVHGYLNGSTVIVYTVANSCGSAMATHSIRVNIPAQPIIGPNTVCQLNVTILANSVAGGTWSSSDFLTAVVFNGTVLGVQLGICEITYTVNNACGETSATMEMEVIDCSATGVSEVAATVPSISPNPSNGAFVITIPGAGQQTLVSVSNMLGQAVQQVTVTTGQPTQMLLDVPAGIYTVSAVVNNQPYNARIVVNH